MEEKEKKEKSMQVYRSSQNVFPSNTIDSFII